MQFIEQKTFKHFNLFHSAKNQVFLSILFKLSNLEIFHEGNRIVKSLSFLLKQFNR